MQRRSILQALGASLALRGTAAHASVPRWSAARARDWHARQPWRLGANYVPASAVNQLEMWQAETFDPTRIERELGWARALGMNSMRVYLHDLAWAHDRAGFVQRVERYLAIAAGQRIDTMLVLFDSCWDPQAQSGPQSAPIPGVHNSRWVQSPNAATLADPAASMKLRAYVQDIVGRFAHDKRVLAWDLWNEPDNMMQPPTPYREREAPNKLERVATLLPQVFDWAREMQPQQPLTSGLWNGDDWAPGAPSLNAIQRAQLELSDVLSFHHYGWPEGWQHRARQLQSYGRPVLCTEFLSRGTGSTFDALLPLAHPQRVGMWCWGLVEGRIQTTLPWDSWAHPYTDRQPPVWYHDVLRADGTPYRPAEADLMRRLTRTPKTL